jgi:hypothetical protein
LEARKELMHMLSIMGAGPKTVMIVYKQVYGDGTVSSEGKAKAHPAIAGSKVEYLCATVLPSSLQNMLSQIVVTSCSNVPLLAIFSGSIYIRKTQIKVFALTAPALCRPNALVVFCELCIMGDSLRRQSMDDSSADAHLKSARRAAEIVYVSPAAWTLQTNTQCKSAIDVDDVV